jgi:hypothetical protein
MIPLRVKKILWISFLNFLGPVVSVPLLRSRCSSLDPAAQASQRFPSWVVRTRIAGTGCLIAVYAAARAKALAIWLAKRPGRQGQEHLFPEHVFKRKATVLIITDFRLRCGDCMLGTERVHSRWTEEQIKLPGKKMLNRLDASSAGHFELTPEGAFQPDVGDDFFRSAMLMEHLGAPFGGEIAYLSGFAAKINGRRPRGWQSHGKLVCLTFEIRY